VFCLLIYAVVSKKSVTTAILPTIPVGASTLIMFGNEFSVCTPLPSSQNPTPEPNTGIIGNGSYANSNIASQTYVLNYQDTLGQCMFDGDAIQVNVWDALGMNWYALLSTTNTTQQLINFYLPGFTQQNFLGTPSATQITQTTLTITSSDGIITPDVYTYSFTYSTDFDNPLLTETVSGIKVDNFIQANVTGLTADTTYYFYCSAVGVDESFTSATSTGISTTSNDQFILGP